MSAALRTIEIPYAVDENDNVLAPRMLQYELHDLLDSFRFGVAVCHRRFGKTTSLVNELQKRALSSSRPDYRGGYIAPLFSQAKAIAWDILKRIAAVTPGVRINESELRVDYANGSRLRLFGSDNPDALRGMYFDDVVFDEVDQMKMEVWTEVVRPALADRLGNAYFIGTFRYVNGPLGKLYDEALANPEWFAKIYRASDTDIVSAKEREAIQRVISEEEYAREFECARSAAVKGSYFGKLIDQADNEGRIARVPHDPALQTVTAWDIGVSDSTAIWFVQPAGNVIHVIDYHEDSGEGVPHYVGLVTNAKPYAPYREHLFPHDMEARDWSVGKPRIQIAQQLGLRPIRVVKRVVGKEKTDAAERIDAVRRLLPRCVFDAEKCEEGINALRSYRREYNERLGEFKENPLHDWASHGADSFGCLARGVLEGGGLIHRPTVNTGWVV